jgi:hypothetical protein
MFASALVNLAILKEETGDREAAAQLLERALALRRLMFGPAAVPYADTAFSLGRVLFALQAAGPQGGGSGGGAAAAQTKGGGWFGGKGAGGGKRGAERALGLMGEAIKVIEDSGEGWWRGD